MPIPAILLTVLAIIGTVAVIVIEFLTAKWIIEKVKEYLAGRKNHKIIFMDTQEMVNTDAVQKIAKEKGVSMKELRRQCKEKPYIFADYNMDVKNVDLAQPYAAKKVDKEVTDIMKERRGHVVLDG